jgi:hypothetical protein
MLRLLFRARRQDGYVTHTTETDIYTIYVHNTCLRQEEIILKTKTNMEV